MKSAPCDLCFEMFLFPSAVWPRDWNVPLDHRISICLCQYRFPRLSLFQDLLIPKRIISSLYGRSEWLIIFSTLSISMNSTIAGTYLDGFYFCLELWSDWLIMSLVKLFVLVLKYLLNDLHQNKWTTLWHFFLVIHSRLTPGTLESLLLANFDLQSGWLMFACILLYVLPTCVGTAVSLC